MADRGVERAGSKPAMGWIVTGAMLALSCIAPTARAHHEISVYDRSKATTLAGTIKEFKYTNPHTWIYLLVPDQSGLEQEWKLEGGPVNGLVRQGWNRQTLAPGMKVKLLYAPRRDGQIGGEWLRVIEMNGLPFDNPARRSADK